MPKKLKNKENKLNLIAIKIFLIFYIKFLKYKIEISKLMSSNILNIYRVKNIIFCKKFVPNKTHKNNSVTKFFNKNYVKIINTKENIF